MHKKIILVEKGGGCSTIFKARHAQTYGAIMMILVDTETAGITSSGHGKSGDSGSALGIFSRQPVDSVFPFIPFSISSSLINIPTLIVSFSDGKLLRKAVEPQTQKDGVSTRPQVIMELIVGGKVSERPRDRFGLEEEALEG